MLEILVGKIASGKSTYCKAMAMSGALIVNDDSLVNSIHAGANYLYKPELKPLYKQLDSVIIHFGLNGNYQVIIDRPNLNPKTRRRYIEIAHSLDKKVRCILFPFLDKKIHIDRRMNENRGYSRESWEKVYDRQLSEYVEPSLDEGFCEIIKYEDLYKIG